MDAYCMSLKLWHIFIKVYTLCKFLPISANEPLTDVGGAASIAGFGSKI